LARRADVKASIARIREAGAQLSARGTKSPQDRAMNIANPGGIDLNTASMTMDATGEAVNIQFDKAMIEQFKRGDFTGVRPVILNITPIPNILPLLGLSPAKQDEVLAKT
jgi:hypothetical protein